MEGFPSSQTPSLDTLLLEGLALSPKYRFLGTSSQPRDNGTVTFLPQGKAPVHFSRLHQLLGTWATPLAPLSGVN